MEASSTSAEYIPSPSTSSSATRIVLFYKYVNIADVAALCAEQRSLATSLGLLGRVLIAAEGVNGTLSGAPAAIDGYIAAMSALALFGGVDWKTSAAGTGVGVGSGVGVGVGVGELEPQLEPQPEPHQLLPFPDMVVKEVRQIVSLGGAAVDLSDGGQHLSPAEFHEALSAAGGGGGGGEREVVLLDVRNTFEHAIGQFEGSISPEMREFSAFPTFVDRHAEEWKGKQVLMYCTGGIRCEKASAYVRSKGIDSVGQLSGGIHRYLEAYPDGGHFRGKNFVFDQRVAVASTDATVVGRCVACAEPYDELSGGRVCTVCRDLVLVCAACQGDAALREFHCAAHSEWAWCYFSFLEAFSDAELQQQAEGLQRLWQNACGDNGTRGKEERAKNKRLKSKRATLRKQIEKVEAERARRKAAADEPEPQAEAAGEEPATHAATATAVARRCRTCRLPAAECNGNCWGFWTNRPGGREA